MPCQIKIMQVNTNRSAEAMNIVERNIAKKEIDVVIVSEPNKRKIETGKWLKNGDMSVAIKITNLDIRANSWEEGSGFVAIKTKIGTIVGCYLTPNNTIEFFKEQLEEISQVIDRRDEQEIIVAGDFNAKSAAWGSNREDRRGTILCEWMSEKGLIVANKGNRPTWRRGKQEAHIDITMCNEKLIRSIKNWIVEDEENLSDHLNILFSLEMGEGIRGKDSGDRRWKRREELVERYQEGIQDKLQAIELLTPELLTSITTKTCDEIYDKKRRAGLRRGNLYWWNDVVKEAKERTDKYGRTLTRANAKVNNEPEKLNAHRQYEEAKKNA
nr:uncharacterized protein LOC111426083 [Onthophagus taurus]